MPLPYTVDASPPGGFQDSPFATSLIISQIPDEGPIITRIDAERRCCGPPRAAMPG